MAKSEKSLYAHFHDFQYFLIPHNTQFSQKGIVAVIRQVGLLHLTVKDGDRWRYFCVIIRPTSGLIIDVRRFFRKMSRA